MKITKVVHDGPTTTVTMSTPLGEITQSVTCSKEDIINNKYSEDAGGLIATRKCETEYLKRKTAAFRQRAIGAKMLVDTVINQTETLEENSARSAAYYNDNIEGRWDVIVAAEDALDNIYRLTEECKEQYLLYRDTMDMFIDYAQHKYPAERKRKKKDGFEIRLYNLDTLSDEEKDDVADLVGSILSYLSE